MSVFGQLFIEYSEERAVDEVSGEILRRCFLDSYAVSDAAEISSDDVQDTVSRIYKEVPDQSNRRRAINLLRDFFTYIEEKVGIILPRVPSHPDVPFYDMPDKDSLASLALSGRDGRGFALWAVLRTDLSVGEICALRRCDVTVDAGKCTFIPALVRTRTAVEENAEKRTVEAEPGVEEAAQVSEILAAAGAAGDFIAQGRAGTPVSLSTLRRDAVLFGEKNGFPCSLDLLIRLRDWDPAAEAAETAERSRPETPEEPEPAEESAYEEIPDEKLERIIADLPAPLRDHSARCAAIAAFTSAQFETEDWFIDLGIDPDYLIRAARFHDIGKKKVELDDLYLPARSDDAKKKRYYAHVFEGVALMKNLGKASPAVCRAASRDGVLRDAILGHHEYVNGRGAPEGVSADQIPFAGRFVCVIDTVDHLIFDSDGLEEKPVEEKTAAALELLGNDSGKKYDQRVVSALLAHSDLFAAFVQTMSDAAGDRAASLGMSFEFYPFTETGRPGVVAYGTELYINDAFYGRIKAETIRRALDDNAKFYVFEKLELEHMCKTLSTITGHGRQIPPVILEISVQSFRRKTFAASVAKIVAAYGNLYRQLIVGLDEQELIASGEDYQTIADRIHGLGFLFAITGFGGQTTLLPSLNRLAPDFIVMKEEYGKFERDVPVNWEVLMSTIQAAQRFNIRLFVPGVDNPRKVEKLQKSGRVCCAGDLIGRPLTENEFAKIYKI